MTGKHKKYFWHCFLKNKTPHITVEIHTFGWYFNTREDYNDMTAK